MSEQGPPNDTTRLEEFPDEILSLISRFRSEWEQALQGNAEPDLDQYVTQLPPEVQLPVRKQLEEIDKDFRAKKNGLASTETEPAITNDGTVVEAPPRKQASATIVDDVQDGSEPETPLAAGASPTINDKAATVDLACGRAKPNAASAESLSAALDDLSEFEILGELGRGGMGVVFKAREKSVNRIVALKMMLAGKFASREHMKRFHIEAEAVASLDHPNIVPIFHVGEVNGAPYFTMKYIEGTDLEKKVGEHVKSPRAAALLLEKICRAVDYAHKRGILHRDLKPANILIDEQGEPHITDFGLAKRMGDNEGATTTGVVMGTPDYMSPEQARGDTHSISVATDVYSLGTILFDLLTGEPPFHSATVVETLIRVTKEPAKAPTSINRAVDSGLETICMKCLEKEPEKRYGSARELADELAHYLAGEPISARPVGRLERTWRWCQRNPAVASLLTAVVVLVAAWVIGLNSALIRISEEKELAVASEKAANRARDEARTNEAFAVETLNDVIKIFHDGLRDRPGLRAIRDKLLFAAAEKLNQFQQSEQAYLDGVQSAELLRRTTIALNQRFGDALFAAGRVEDALPYYQRMESLILELHDDSPDVPDAKKFMAAASNKLADTFVRLGELHRGLEHYRDGLKYRKQWVDLLERTPTVNRYALMNAKWDVSVSYLLISNVHLRMGDLLAASNALEQSDPWADAVPEGATFETVKDFHEMSLRFERQADVQWRIDGLETAHSRYEAAIKLLHEGLSRPGITKLRLKRQLATCYLSLGDAHLRLNGDAATARPHCEVAMKICREILSQDAGDTPSKALLANSFYKQGVVALMQKELARSDALFADCLKLRREIANAASQDVLLQADLMMALARCGLHKQAIHVAENVRKEFDEPVASYLVGKCYSVCASEMKVVSQRGRPPEPRGPSIYDYESKALAELTKAIQHGWHDLRYLETDPDLADIDLEPLRQGFE